MPFGGLLSIAGPLISGAGALSGLFGGSPAQNVSIPQTGSYSPGTLPPGFNIPQTYNTQNMGGADTGAYGGIGSLSQYNVPGQLLPQYQTIAQAGVNNPYASSYQTNANQTGALGMGSGAALTDTALGQLPSVGALMSLGFDPQNALYAKLQNQNQQQNAAILGQSGVAGTPYGAGVATDANSNFNINWQNQQLARALQGAQGAGGLLGSIGGATGTGLDQMATGAGLPYNVAFGITGNQLGILGQYGQFGQSAANLPQQQIQDYLSYLAQGTSQQGANTGVGQLGLGLGQLGVSQGQLGVNQGQLGLNQSGQAFNQNQAFGNQLGGALAGLGKGWGNAFGGGAGGGGMGNFNTTQTPWGNMPMASTL